MAANLVVAPHPDGNQTQHIIRELPVSEAASDMAELLDYIESHLEHDLSVASLASRFHMSTRHLSRRFSEAIGTTPAQWVRQRRLDAARRLLEKTGMPIAHVAQAAGFHSPITFRQAFHNAFARIPAEKPAALP